MRLTCLGLCREDQAWPAELAEEKHSQTRSTVLIRCSGAMLRLTFGGFAPEQLSLYQD